MKYLLIPLAFAAAQAMACPADGSKDAMAPAAGKTSVAANAAPAAQPTRKASAAPKATSTKGATKLASKPATDAKTAPL
jgi:hypothetical protein